MDGRDRRGQAGPEEWFTGRVWLEEVVEAPPRLRAPPGHLQPQRSDGVEQPSLGQALEVVSGRARIGRADGVVELLSAGNVLWFDPNRDVTKESQRQTRSATASSVAVSRSVSATLTHS